MMIEIGRTELFVGLRRIRDELAVLARVLPRTKAHAKLIADIAESCNSLEALFRVSR
jgi:hypothetical protein